MPRIRPSTGAIVWSVLLIALLGLIALSTALRPDSKRREVLTNRSVYNTNTSGYRAWYLTLRETGIPLTIWQKPFKALPPVDNGSTMLVIEPYTASSGTWTFSDEQVSTLLDWVRQGNRLVLLDRFQRQGSQTLLRKVGLKRQGKPGKKGAKPHPLYAVEYSDFVKQPLQSESPYWLEARKNGAYPFTPLLTDDRAHTVAVKLDYGKGAMVLVSMADVASNAFLHAPVGNYQWLANVLVSRETGASGNKNGAIWVNEFVHGYFEHPDLLSYYLQATPLGAVFVQLAFGFAMLVWLSMLPVSHRQSPASTASDEPGGMAATIESMAGFYYKAQASALVLSPMLKQLESRFRRRLRVSLNEPANRWQPLLERHLRACDTMDESPEALMESLHKARHIVSVQERVPHREAYRIARHLAIIDESLSPEAERRQLHE